MNLKKALLFVGPKFIHINFLTQNSQELVFKFTDWPTFFSFWILFDGGGHNTRWGAVGVGYLEMILLVPGLYPLSHLPRGAGPGQQTPGFVQYAQGQGFEAICWLAYWCLSWFLISWLPSFSGPSNLSILFCMSGLYGKTNYCYYYPGLQTLM